ncbi:glycoside hydrolase superfamily [Naematelia encephala]|uniref:Beta-galactosidase n=1 Tax=Naematelia encephala TaxID=71784 RepID=A0A1Y2ANS4_9TREE|nr:glycoside hydrolase superfamily [Naematelia encephala]
MRFWLTVLGLVGYTLNEAAISTDILNEAAISTANQQVFTDVPLENFRPSSTLKSTNLTDEVQWDGYSLFVKGQRIYLWSGEVHNWRVVVPDLYPDIMQRIKALGFNAISIYTFWGLNNPAPGVIDFDGWKDVRPFLEAANDAGLWVVARPGPYINAEVTGGGIPGWVTGLNVSMRTSDPAFSEAYEPYWKAVGEIFAEYQITYGGPIIAVQIENEYYVDGSFDGDLDLDYIQHLEELMLDYGIVVPLTFNDVNQRYRLVNGKGSVDIYGADSYPQRVECGPNQEWSPVSTTWRPYFRNTSGEMGEPFYMPEFQGGWIPTTETKGYEYCLPLFGSEFQWVFYLNNIAQSVKMHNVYMVYGGTNYGHTAFPLGLTSYDYWAAISEDRAFKDKYYGLKLMSHFVRSSRDLPKTWPVASGDSIGTDAAPGIIQVDELRNPDTDAGFYVVRHANSSSLEHTSFNLSISDWQGKTAVPVTLNGRDSRIIATNFCWGTSCISHSSAAILTSTVLGDVDVLVVYGEPGQPYELSFPETSLSYEGVLGKSSIWPKSAAGRTSLQLSIKAGDISLVRVSGAKHDIWVFVLDTAQANFAWETVVPRDTEFGNHYSIGSNETVLTFGPYFVRSAENIDETLALSGDLNATTHIYIAAPSSYTSFSWNNASIKPKSVIPGLWSLELPGPVNIPEVPEIVGWKWRDSLPEITPEYDDSAWVIANHTTTPNPNQPYPGYSGKYVLYGMDYGYAVGNTIWRGHFLGTGHETGLNISLSPGAAGAGAVWINGEYLGSAFTENADAVEVDVNVTFKFRTGVVNKGVDNVIVSILKVHC